MAESSLSITRTDLKRAVARAIGITRTSADWTSDDSDAINDIIEEGEREFYSAYPWSFLQPIDTFILTAGDCDLPDDFGGFIGHELHYQRSDNAWYPVQLTSVSEVLKARGLSGLETSTFPRIAATTWLPSAGTQGQRQALMVWPAPTAELAVRGQYYSIPYAIADSTPYPLGGQMHSGTLRAAVLAAAEVEEDGQIGPWHQKYAQRLAASIKHEQLTAPRNLGSMRGDARGGGNIHDHSSHFVTYGGVDYSQPG